MNTQFWLIQAFNGISYGALLFLVGSGLSLIFGVMQIVNLSHGSYFLLGGYVALSVIWNGPRNVPKPVVRFTNASALNSRFPVSRGSELVMEPANLPRISRYMPSAP